MQRAALNTALSLGLAVGLVCAPACANAGDADNTLKVGYAHIGFNTKSADLTGPAGTTPPGVQAGLNNTATMALVYERNISGPWCFVLQGGTPPVVKIFGAGNAAALGEVGTTRAWFPAFLGQYAFEGPWGSQPYVGAGVNYTFYTEGWVKAAYTGAFGGTGSTAKLTSSWGPVLKVGIGFPLGRTWVIDAAYSRYSIHTTATITTDTPGVGAIARSVGIRSDPDVVALIVGHRF